MVQTPGEGVAIKGAAAGLRDRVGNRVEKSRAPKPVGLLGGEDGIHHALVETDVARVVGMVARDAGEHAGKPGDDPAIAPGPVDVAAVGLAKIEETLVPEKQSVSRRVKGVGREPPLRVHKLEVAAVAGEQVGVQPGSGGHEKRVAPGPAVECAAETPVERGECRLGQNPFEESEGRSHHFAVTAATLKLGVGLDHALIVGVVRRWDEIPLEGVEPLGECIGDPG